MVALVTALRRNVSSLGSNGANRISAHIIQVDHVRFANAAREGLRDVFTGENNAFNGVRIPGVWLMPEVWRQADGFRDWRLKCSASVL